MEKMKSQKQIMVRIKKLKEDFFKLAFKSDKELAGGTKISLKVLKNKIEELNWVLDIN